MDAYNEVIIQRGFFPAGCDRTAVLQQIENQPSGPSAWTSGQIIRIPLRRQPGAPLPFHAEDVILQTGDVVFLEARDDDVFYTGGLLPPGSYVLPRDRDLDVIEAISRVRGPLFNGAFGGSNLSCNLIAPGIGGPSPTLLAKQAKTLGVTGVLGFIVVAIMLLSTIEDTFNDIWGVTRGRDCPRCCWRWGRIAYGPCSGRKR